MNNSHFRTRLASTQTVALFMSILGWNGILFAAETPKNLADLRSKAEVGNFLFELTENQTFESAKKQFFEAAPPERQKHYTEHPQDLDDFLRVGVSDYRLLDLNNDGKQVLIAAIAHGGRQVVNTFIVVIATGTGHAYSEMYSAPEASLKDQLVDLEGDGRQRLLIREHVFPDRQGDRLPWIGVAEFKGLKLVRVDKEHPAYYRDRFIPDIEKQLADLNTKNLVTANRPGHSWAEFSWIYELPSGQKLTGETRAVTEDEREGLQSRYQVLLDKAQRIVTNSAEDERTHAKVWAKSSNFLLRFSAIPELLDIGDDESVAQLKVLAHDTDHDVAGAAEGALTVLNQSATK